MGSREPVLASQPHELGLVIEVLADTQESASAVGALARSTMLHVGYPGRKTTAGNLALPYSPADIDLGPAYEFSVYHLLQIDESTDLFPISVNDVSGARA